MIKAPCGKSFLEQFKILAQKEGNDDVKTYYITTPIYYVNDKPHIGHAYTTTACDVMSRYKRMKGYDVFFLTGTDEHGQKIQSAAEAKGETPQQLVDRVHQTFRDLCTALNVGNNDFIRTTEPRHIRTVQAIFSRLMEQGDIYKGTYTGYYCVPDETYVPENAMGPNKTCPDCGRPLTIMEEESYFFRAAKYVPQLIEYYEAHMKAVMPRQRYNEIMSFLKSGVRDQSVSRTSLKWGIPVPGDEKHVIYVWFDALVNYLTAAGYLDDPEKFAHWWPSVRHMVGKDIIRFHCVTWPLVLLALGISLPVEVFAHGWWTVDGEKMSKTRGNVVDPFKIVKEYGRDAFRYFMMREVPFGNDGDFSELALVGRINSDLANDLGNLLNRTHRMIVSYRGGVVPASDETCELAEMSARVLETVDAAMNEYAFDEALKAVWEFIGRANKFIDETMPWKLAKDEAQSTRLDFVLLNLYEALRLSAMMIAPVMPETAARIWGQLGVDGEPVRSEYSSFVWGQGAGNKLGASEVLFPRIDINEWKKHKEEQKLQESAKKAEAQSQQEASAGAETPSPSQQAQSETQAPSTDHEAEISIDDFRTVEMRVARITKCEEIPKSKKLYKLTVDLGYETRTVCSGIKAFFTPSELEGRRIILVTNLKPVKLCGVESSGMILCASVKKDGVSEQLTLIKPEDDNIPLGSRVS
ncbi:MAG: methionine--tRNA ligase [Synergistaceae bacterium]|nr:methionine--tRNA ligase [Synergistaceae bacterium]